MPFEVSEEYSIPFLLNSFPVAVRVVGRRLDDADFTSPKVQKSIDPPVGPNSRSHRSKRSVSKEWNLEIMVVADSKMKRYHGDNLEMYILTLMSSVALIYKDPSIGNNINLSIVKLVIMSDGEDAGIIFPSASKTLRNFCRWQQEFNDPQGFHHDTAILLTREDLCRHSKTCDTLGLAQSGMACDKESSCAVIEDNGLSAAFTIAHEIGHVLGIPHDDDTKCSRFHKHGHRLHVMARMLDYNSHPWSWSECSRHFITTFLDAGYGYCLLNKPKQDLLERFEHAKTAAGELYDMDYQCELVFGKSSRICPYMPVCKRLWCTMEDITQGGCRTQHMPWADGTRCGPDKSCIHGECLQDPVHLAPPQNGEWGEWRSYGPCSRSCGGGITRSIRECDNPRPTNGGRYCVGDRVRYKSCQTHDCPLGTKDFREEQCSAFNGKTFGFVGVDQNVRWVPHFAGVDIKDRCKLYCRAAGTAAYFLLKEKVIDGTTCGPDTFDICINGKCMAAGCDHKLNSNKITDACGVCGGNGTSCRVIRGKFTEVQYGYNTVVTIPAGASNVEILQFGHENTKDDNYLALMGSDHLYILNGDFMISMFPKSIQYAGSLIEYSGSDTIVERINASKRLQKELYVQVLTVGSLHQPGISYEYTVSLDVEKSYRWHLEESWSPCNSICQGEQYRKAICVNSASGETVNDAMCHEQERPVHEAKVCNPNCVLRWDVTHLEPCSSSCGRGVIKNEVKCYQQTELGETQSIPEHFCAHMEPRPPESLECFGQCKTRQWKYGEWSQCSTSCGVGIQYRKAVCLGDESVELPDAKCENSSKITEQACLQEDCPLWKASNWSECSVSCGHGERRRTFHCQLKDKVISRTLCNDSHIPPVIESCNQHPCTEWETGPWEPCSVTCGSGTKQRRIYCAAHGRAVPPEQCNASTKPLEKTSCELPICIIKSDQYHRIFENLIPSLLPDPSEEDSLSTHSSNPNWITGNWSSCSAICGEGLMYRQVLCHNPANERVLPDRRCSRHRRPSHIRTCYAQTCGRWITGKWSECSATCGPGIQTRRVACFMAGDKSSGEEMCDFYSKPKKEKSCNLIECQRYFPQYPIPPVLHNSVESIYYWRTGLWGKCSKSCGGGTRRRQVACYDDAGQLSHNCDSTRKPPDMSPCNLERCPSWSVGNWTQCSVSCGKGTRRRTVQCMNNRGQVIARERCEGPIPESEQRCKSSQCLQWAWSSWSQCSATCGQGIRIRIVHCRRGHQEVPSEECASLPKRSPETKVCKSSSCNVHWKKRKWSKCSATCGKGFQYRDVFCVSGKNDTVPDSQCSHQKKPKIRRKCHQYQCPVTWMTSQWSECSTSCGKGVQTRIVTCHRVNAYQWVDPEPLLPSKGNNVWCKDNEKPSTSKNCNLGECSRNIWKPGPWSQCSSECGPGRQRRRIYCSSEQKRRLPHSQCELHLKPQKRRRCFKRPCQAISCLDFRERANITRDGEQEIFVRGRYVKIYCSRMNTSKPQEYITLIRGEQDNYSEVYSKRLKNPNSCPYRGARYDSCECTSDESIGAGLTTYQRIAINITSLKIITHDMTFSQTHVGEPVPFAQSGDCYSIASCPQGRFSLSLLGTGFMVDPQTKWIADGQYPSSRIRWLEGGQVIQGKCGGYCAKCVPDNSTGLQLEVAPP
ncbi:A disintegrin and metalloproteinase with thrombospondin motifs 9-like [Uloborus diversus]|uniref:A disintegrin and metalloproteinase with thrombospondin motifs 9-like n=1 Tax=Uloborus diversus TaxID=327109 RepID=UPI002409BD7C|nr:A disintegrin and metalloproteinase with thrombospondin motifs 9-like [Uloborus diversus]